jgi:hypothetical protein
LLASAAIQRASMPGGLQVGRGLLQVGGLARGQHDLGAGLAQRLGHLQAQAARAAGDQGRLAGQVEQFLDGTGHGVAMSVQSGVFVHARAVIDQHHAGRRSRSRRHQHLAPAPSSLRPMNSAEISVSSPP